MKKTKLASIFLCIVLLSQCMTVQVSAASAAETTAATTAIVPQTLPQDKELKFGQVCIEKGCRTINGKMPLAGSDKRLETALAAFLYEVDTGTVVYAYHPDDKVPAGTLTKIVTSMVALENMGLEDRIFIDTNNISRLPAGSTVKDLKNGETVTVRDLICCMLLENANDAAVVISEKVAGNQSTFVNLMNKWVNDIGCTNTEFGNVHGLDNATNTTSARDMAKIVNAAIQNEDFKYIFGLDEYTMPETEKSNARDLITTNYFLSNRTIPDFYTTDIKGGMQSMTHNAGASLVVTAEKNGMRYIAVTLGSTRVLAENGWSVITYGNFNEMTDLITYGFNNFKVNRIVYDGMAMGQFKVLDGECDAIGEAQVDVTSVVPIKAQMGNLQMNFDVGNKGLSAPVKKGDLIATMEVKYLNSVMTEVEVYAMNSVKHVDNTGVTIRSTALRSDADDSGILSVIGTISVIILGLAAVYLAYNAFMRSRMRARYRKRRANRRRLRQ